MSAVLTARAWAFRVTDDAASKLVLLALVDEADAFGCVEATHALFGRLTISTGLARGKIDEAVAHLQRLGALERGTRTLQLRL